MHRCLCIPQEVHFTDLIYQPMCSYRYQLTTMVVDTEAGPHKNCTVLFLGSTRGTILKFLMTPGGDSVSHSSVFLEEVEGFNPEKWVWIKRSSTFIFDVFTNLGIRLQISSPAAPASTCAHTYEVSWVTLTDNQCLCIISTTQSETLFTLQLPYSSQVPDIISKTAPFSELQQPQWRVTGSILIKLCWASVWAEQDVRTKPVNHSCNKPII